MTSKKIYFMKYLIVVFLILGFSQLSLAQTRGTKYCQVIFKSHYGKKNAISTDFTINLGAEDRGVSSEDDLTKDELEKLKSLHSTIGILNYMASIGWTMVTMDAKDSDQGFIYFKRERR